VGGGNIQVIYTTKNIQISRGLKEHHKWRSNDLGY